MRTPAALLGAAVLAGGVLLGTAPAAAPGGFASATPSVLSQHKAELRASGSDAFGLG